MNYPPISKLLIFNKFNKIAIFLHRQIHVQYNYKRSFLFSFSLSLAASRKSEIFHIYIYIYYRPIKRSKHRTRMKINARPRSQSHGISISHLISPNRSQACFRHASPNYTNILSRIPRPVHCIAFHEGGEGASSLRTTLAPNFEGLAPGPHPCAVVS